MHVKPFSHWLTVSACPVLVQEPSAPAQEAVVHTESAPIKAQAPMTYGSSGGL